MTWGHFNNRCTGGEKHELIAQAGRKTIFFREKSKRLLILIACSNC